MKIPFNKTTGEIGGSFAWAQDPFIQAIEDQYNKGLPVRIIVLKARQLGFSTITEGVIFNWLFIHPGTHALVLAHETDVSEELFHKTKHYWETWPFNKAFHLQYSTKSNIRVLETGSQLKIATAQNRMSGRGHTIHAAHLSEVAFYPDPKSLMGGLNSSVPNEHGSIMILESTANGIGNFFYNMWNEAEEGSNEFQPLFFPWWKHPEYKIYSSVSTGLELSPDERFYLKQMSSYGYSDSTCFDHLAWRRWAIRNRFSGDIEQFMAEFPATPEEAFRMSGTPVFSHDKLKVAFHDRENCVCHGGVRGYLIESINRRHNLGGGLEFRKDRGGPLTIYKYPSKTDRAPERYFIGADPAETIYGDLANAQVITRDVTKPIEQIAVYSNRVDAPTFAIEIMKLGRFYNYCMVCPEAEGGGQACIQRVLDHNYPLVWLHQWPDKAPGKKSNSYGWSMNWNRKRWCVGMVQNYLFNDQLIIHDHETYVQLADYASWGEELGNASGQGHDDAVMALCIAVTASYCEPAYIPGADRNNRTHPVIDIFTPENSWYDSMIAGNNDGYESFRHLPQVG